MYRQRQRMAEPNLNLEFASKVSNFPMVNTAWIFASGTYGRVKNYSGLLNYTLTTAEKSVSLAAEQAKPVVMKFEKQIHAVDGLACKGLDKLQEKIPVIADSPEEILQKTRQLYASTIQSGINKYDGLKNYGSGKVKIAKEFGVQKATAFMDSPYGHFISSTLNEALVITENYVNHYLPPLETEGETDQKADEKPLAERVGSLSDRVQNRMYHHVSKQMSQAQETLARLNSTLDVIQLCKDNLNTANLALQSTALRVWERISKDELPSGGSAVDQMFFTARNLARVAASTANSIATPPLNYLPQTAKQNLEAVNKYAASVYTQLAQAKTAEEKSMVLKTQLRDSAKVMESSIYSIIDSVWKLNALRWFVSTSAVAVPETQSVKQE